VQKTLSERLRWSLGTAYLVTVFGSLYAFTKVRKFLTGDKSPTMVIPFVGGSTRRY
jgi:hypothetical protein